MKAKLIIEFSEIWLKAVLVDPQAKTAQKLLYIESVQAGFINISAGLESILKQAGKAKAFDVVLVLSRSKTTLRRIDLPSREPSEIEQMLGLHVIRQVPYPKEEIVWGYKNLGFDGISNTKLLLAIVHRDILRSIFNSFISTNFLPESILISSQGVVHYAQVNCKDKALLQQAYLILDIDATYCDLICVNKQQLSSSVAIPFGFDQLKTDEGLHKFFPEMRQALLAFREELMGVKTAQLFLTGLAADISDFDLIIQQELNLRTQVIKTEDSEELKALSKGVSVTALSGFAYQQKRDDLCFTLPEAKIKKEIKLRVQQLLILGICVTYIFILIGLIVFSELNKKLSYRNRLNLRVSALKEKNKPLEQISQKVNALKPYMDTKSSVLFYIYELNRILPDSITLTSLSWEKKTGLVLKGYANQMQDIFSFVSILDNSKVFKGMKTQSTRRHKVKDKEIVDFEIGAK